MKIKSQFIIGTVFVLTGLVVGHSSFMQLFNRPGVAISATSTNIPVKAKAEQKKVNRVEGKPNRIVINSLKIDLLVVDGFYNTKQKTWTLYKDKAQYATITPKSNNIAGNTFIYGHNNPQVFINLRKIKPGDKTVVYTENGYQFNYVFRGSYETNPYDDSLFNYNGPAILTLQTCSGLWYQNRQLFTFDFEGVS